VAGLRAYVDGPDPAFPADDPRFGKLQQALVDLRPPPAELAPLFAPRPPASEVDARLIKRDAIALAVLDSLLRRWFAGNEVPAPLLDVAVGGGVHFSFDPLYGESHTRTGEELADFLSTAPVTPEVGAAAAKHLDAFLARWRARTTDKSSSTMFGIVLRTLGEGGGERLFREWDGMHEEERIDLFERLAWMDSLGRGLLLRAADGILDPSIRIRRSAHRALERHGAPVGALDPSAREADLRVAVAEVRRWIDETKP